MSNKKKLKPNAELKSSLSESGTIRGPGITSDDPSSLPVTGEVRESLPVNSEAHAHSWVVFSTALSEVWLMVQCCDCGLHGAVIDPSAEEWSDAFTAPSNPYLWDDETRVVAHPEIPREPREVFRTDLGLGSS